MNGLVTFIDWGYKAYDATAGFIKNIGGEDAAKVFDKFSGVLTTFANLAVIAGLSAVKLEVVQTSVVVKVEKELEKVVKDRNLW